MNRPRFVEGGYIGKGNKSRAKCNPTLKRFFDVFNLTGERRCILLPKQQKPGEKAPRSGQYEIIGQRGGRTGEERTVTRGEPLPPTPKPGQKYEIVDPTKH